MESGEHETLLDYRREEAGTVVRVKVLAVPESEKFPDGVKYRLHYGTLEGDTILRYDNSHGIHEKHVGDEVEEIEFPAGGVEELYRRFVADVE